jgi:hypothetical protein
MFFYKLLTGVKAQLKTPQTANLNDLHLFSDVSQPPDPRAATFSVDAQTVLPVSLLLGIPYLATAIADEYSPP